VVLPELKPVRRRQGFRVTTSRGTVDAEHVIIATNADGLVPWLRRRVAFEDARP
jgi:glycine/D-amino acid oxidase-like deaminating enzyme